MQQVSWQKSSYSASTTNNECVEVGAAANETVALRESDAPGTVIVTAPGAFAALIRTVKAAALRA
ncbi:DUF397 domain-containing protein [Streptomyces abikoensis]|uniref:DUF397 domain-containing protein n=1 Tax=Streptomyces abikoensis TaxID=97398 RepID=UPI00167B46E7|nr:DUF397 domain-containing protein [Streptomyces abikoensis]GGP71344.1 hypothetical protein GCM10010214_52740 [Streptomyces abikoensis]